MVHCGSNSRGEGGRRKKINVVGGWGFCLGSPPSSIIISSSKRTVIYNLLGNVTSLPTWKNLSPVSRVFLTSSIIGFRYCKNDSMFLGTGISFKCLFMCVFFQKPGCWDRSEVPNY